MTFHNNGTGTTQSGTCRISLRPQSARLNSPQPARLSSRKGTPRLRGRLRQEHSTYGVVSKMTRLALRRNGYAPLAAHYDANWASYASPDIFRIIPPCSITSRSRLHARCDACKYRWPSGDARGKGTCAQTCANVNLSVKNARFTHVRGWSVALCSP